MATVESTERLSIGSRRSNDNSKVRKGLISPVCSDQRIMSLNIYPYEQTDTTRKDHESLIGKSID